MLGVNIMLFCAKRCLRIMDNFEYPNKKPRLDNDDWENNFLENDDLWGQAELTAEEFDMLEIQATQKVQAAESCQPSTSRLSRKKTLPPRCLVKSPAEESLDNEVKQQQYALEGQVKLLSESLDKAVHELTTERMSRQKIIDEKVEERKSNEEALKKEIERLQTAFQFKEQENKSVYNKLQLLEQKVKAQSDGDCANGLQQSNYAHSMAGSNNFLDRFQFKKKYASTREFAVQTVQSFSDSAQVLPLILPKGEPKGTDILSRLLINRTGKGISAVHTANTVICNSSSSSAVQVALPSIAKLSDGTETSELWHSYEVQLKQHISFLRSARQKQNILAFKKTKPPVRGIRGLPSSRAPLSSLEEEIEKQHEIINFYLKDLAELFLWQCPTESSHLPFRTELSEQTIRWLTEQDCPTAYSNPLFADDDKMESTNLPPPCLLPLFSLANPETYPDWYYYKTEELESSLRALTSWSLKSTASLQAHLYNLPLQALVAGQHGIRCAGLILQLISPMLPLKFLAPYIHQTSSCLFASIADLCHAIRVTDKTDYIYLVTMVENFLGSAVSVIHGIDEDGCYCSTQLIQGFIVLLWRHYERCHKNLSQTNLTLIKKGITTLHQLSAHIKSFREKRLPVEDHYVTLICGISKLSKENSSFKALKDAIHDLWDFQDDVVDEADERASD